MLPFIAHILDDNGVGTLLHIHDCHVAGDDFCLREDAGLHRKSILRKSIKCDLNETECECLGCIAIHQLCQRLYALTNAIAR
jgi:hypothetical protein